MAWEWLAPMAEIIFKVWQTTATVATTVAVGAACPPCAPIVTGAFAIGGIALNEGLKGLKGHDSQGLSDAQFRYLNSHLDKITGIVSVNQELLKNIKSMLNASITENRMAMKEMKETLKSFQDNMNHNFAELQAFVVHKDFLEKIEVPIQLLWNAMERASDTQTREAVQEFLKEYNDKSAKRILEEFMVRLSFTHTNHLITAMDAHVMSSRKILEDYLRVMSQLFVKVYAIEGFYHGISDAAESDSDYMARLSVYMNEAILKIHKFVSEYKLEEEKYWPSEVEKVAKSKFHLKIQDIADQIQEELEGIYTNDVFTIYVWSNGPLNNNEPLHSRWLPELARLHPTIKHPGSLYYKFPNVERPDCTTRIVILRSTLFHYTAKKYFDLARTAYRAHGLTHWNIFDKKHITPSGDLYGISFFEIRECYFDGGYWMQGFSVWSSQPEIRYTNNGYSILADDDTDIATLEFTGVFTGISWI